MIVTDSKVKELLLHNTIGRELVIHFPDDDIEDITGGSIVSESMTLERSILKGKELQFGGGIASQFKVKVIGIEKDLTGKNIEVSLKQTVRPLLYPSENLFPTDDLFPCGGTETHQFRIFTGKIDSALRQKNRAIKEVIAYDDFYSNSKFVYDFMTTFAIYSPNATLGDLRYPIVDRLNLAEDTKEISLFNDNSNLSMSLELTKKNIERKKTTSTDFLRAYAELNAAFAVMNNYNQLKYVQLLSPPVEIITTHYDLSWEEFETAGITGLMFAYGDDKNYYSYGYSNLSVYTTDNIITKCCTDVKTMCHNVYDYIANEKCIYRPYKAILFDYWWLEPGDKVVINTGADDMPTVTSYVFDITITGIQNIKTTINAEGIKYLGKEEIDGLQ